MECAECPAKAECRARRAKGTQAECRAKAECQAVKLKPNVVQKKFYRRNGGRFPKSKQNH